MRLFIALVAGMVGVGLLVSLGAWLLMLLLDLLAHITGWPVDISFWACYVIIIIVALLTPTFRD